MKIKYRQGNGHPKGKPATRSAGKRATGNRNKHLLAAERRRTDEADGRLNKQNPVSPQNRTPNDEVINLAKRRLVRINWKQEFIDFQYWLKEEGHLKIEPEKILFNADVYAGHSKLEYWKKQ